MDEAAGNAGAQAFLMQLMDELERVRIFATHTAAQSRAFRARSSQKRNSGICLRRKLCTTYLFGSRQ